MKTILRQCLCLVITRFISGAAVHAATFTVIHTNDTGAGSLRWAITNALASAAPRVVEFSIPGPGPHTIKVADVLPFLTQTISIRGDTQPGYSNSPLVQILGPSTNVLDFGLYGQAANVLIRGLRISGFTASEYSLGVLFDGSFAGMQLAGCVVDGNYNGVGVRTALVGGSSTNDRNIIINNLVNGIITYTGGVATIRGNFIGVEADGLTAAPNGENGIRTFNSSGAAIEGHPDYPQVISGHTNGAGILLGPNGSYVLFSSGNTILGNFIGTDVTGMQAVPNGAGIRVWGGGDNRIGGTSAIQRNIIAGNGGAGISIEGILLAGYVSASNTIYGNYVGLAADGETVLSNYYGVRIHHGNHNRVGGTGAGQGNRFGGAVFYNVFIDASSAFCQSNSVQGNWFGVSVSTQVLAGGSAGVRIGNASNNLVGGTAAAAANYFGGVNTAVGIEGDQARHNRVQGNFIGVSPAGERLQINTYGVHLFNAPRNQVGGVYTNEGNVISGAQWYGVFIERTGSYANVVQGNRIGTDQSATLSVSNRYSGVDIAGGAYSNLIGGTNYAAANVIGGNGGAGVSIRDSNTTANVVQYNTIGMNLELAPVSNMSYGISVHQAPGNQIGPANYIGHHPTTGIHISGEDGPGNRVVGNLVGVDILGVNHPNQNGVGVSSPGTLIGGPLAGDRNYIAGNNVNGVDIGAGGHGTVVQGNLIGLNVFGSGMVSNKQYGVYVNNADNVVIGGLNAARNIIAGSRLTGILVDGTSSNTVIAGNYIGTTENGLIRLGIGTAGIGVNADYTTIGVAFAGLGNVIAGAAAGAIEVNTGANVRIVNNRIGIGADGVTNLPNARGIFLRSGARNVQVGGTNALAANVVARNTGSEVIIEGPASGNLVQGNYIGVMSGGVAFPTGHGGYGVEVIESPSNRILGNVIGQVADAIILRGAGSARNVVQGNYIGEYNLEPMGSSGWGVLIQNASDNRIGGLPIAERNVISYNAGGIRVTNAPGSNAVNNLLAANILYSNSPRLNIELGPTGLNANDVLDADEGANRLQNRPTLTNALTTGTGLVYAQGVLTSAPLTTYAVDIYRADGTNASSRIYLGRTMVNTDAGGVGAFSAGFMINLAPGTYLAATATDPDHNTSEFSASPFGLTSAGALDTDGDGIPDYWETLYGLNPAVSNAPTDDLDLDGDPDLMEYIADTAANDELQYPVIVAMGMASPPSVTFPSSSVRVYRLEFNDQLGTNTVWIPIGGVVTGLYGQTTMSDTNLPSARHYRVAVSMP